MGPLRLLRADETPAGLLRRRFRPRRLQAGVRRSRRRQRHPFETSFLVCGADPRRRSDFRRHLRDERGPSSHPRKYRDRLHGRSRRSVPGRRTLHRRLLFPDDRLPPRRRGYGQSRIFRARSARAMSRSRQKSQRASRRLVGQMVAQDTASRHRVVQLPAHARL